MIGSQQEKLENGFRSTRLSSKNGLPNSIVQDLKSDSKPQLMRHVQKLEFKRPIALKFTKVF